MALPHGLQITCGGSAPGGEIWRNVFFLKQTSGTAVTTRPSQGTADSIGNIFRGWYDGFDQYLAPDWKYQSCVVRLHLGTGDGPPPRNAVVAVLQGTGAQGLGNDVAMCVSWQTDNPTGKGRGRNYIGPPALAALSYPVGGPAVILAACRDAIATASQAQLAPGWPLADYPGTTWRFAIASQGGLSGTPESNAVVSGYVNNLFDTQRRRENRLASAKTSFTMP